MHFYAFSLAFLENTYKNSKKRKKLLKNAKKRRII